MSILLPGQCYHNVVKLLLEYSGVYHGQDPKIAHGYPTGTDGEARGVKYGHAWIEATILDYILPDPRTGKNVRNPVVVYDQRNPFHPILKDVYYEVGLVDQMEVSYYTLEEAMAKMNQTGNYGPWDKHTSKRHIQKWVGVKDGY